MSNELNQEHIRQEISRRKWITLQAYLHWLINERNHATDSFGSNCVEGAD